MRQTLKRIIIVRITSIEQGNADAEQSHLILLTHLSSIDTTTRDALQTQTVKPISSSSLGHTTFHHRKQDMNIKTNITKGKQGNYVPQDFSWRKKNENGFSGKSNPVIDDRIRFSTR